jgi:hypothetical protein
MMIATNRSMANDVANRERDSYFVARCINDCLILFAMANDMSRAGGGGGIGGDNECSRVSFDNVR